MEVQLELHYIYGYFQQFISCHMYLMVIEMIVFSVVLFAICFAIGVIYLIDKELKRDDDLRKARFVAILGGIIMAIIMSIWLF